MLSIPAHTPTEIEAICVNSAMDAAMARKVAEACSDPSIGLDTIVSVLGYENGALGNPGSTAYIAAIAKLIAAVQALDSTCLTTNAEKGQFTVTINKCVIEAANQMNSHMAAIGLTAASKTATTPVVVSGADAEPVVRKEEIEQLRKLDAVIGGCWHTDGLAPAPKLVAHFVRGLAEDPPVIRLVSLGNAQSNFYARQAKKAATALERLVGATDELETRADKPVSKGKFIHALMLVGNALAIAGSRVILPADAGKYRDYDSGKVELKGKEQHVYGTRAITELLLTTCLEEGAKSDPDQLNEGYEAVMKAASKYVSQGYMLNSAFARAVHDERAEWRPRPRREGGGDGKRQKVDQKGKGSVSNSARSKQLDAAREKAKKKHCGDWNTRACPRGEACVYGHTCSAIIERDGRIEVCGEEHTRREHLAQAKAGTAPSVIG
jgi:hypothetical protein